MCPYDRAEIADLAPADDAALRYNGLGGLIDIVGRSDFETRLARQLTQMFDCEFVHISRLSAAQPTMVVSLAADGGCHGEEQSAIYLARSMWRFDPTIDAGSRWESNTPMISRLDVNAPETAELKQFYEATNICERVVAYGKGADGHLGLSIVRTGARGAFTDEEKSRIGVIGEIAFPLMAHHYALMNERNVIASALSSLPLIEHCIALSGHAIPRREAQVAARMLYGMTCEGAALDLSIAYETALSYKKRFYQRFGLGGFRDLLGWYLMQFSGTCHLLYGALKH